NLHKRFHIQKRKTTDNLDDYEEDEGGFIILDIEGNKIGIIIDRINRVVQVEKGEIKPPPQMLSGIGTEYIEGVVRQETAYLIILDTRKMFNANELQKILDPGA
ncbi:MAG: chemotaxis protein CheW, partial [Treponema sp.]|nr:chemotaxis protein CheW [Treponema sp.]